MNQELVKFIEEYLSKGSTTEEIRVVLLKVGGWTNEDIDQAFAMVNPSLTWVVDKPKQNPAVEQVEPVIEKPVPPKENLTSPVIKAIVPEEEKPLQSFNIEKQPVAVGWLNNNQLQSSTPLTNHSRWLWKDKYKLYLIIIFISLAVGALIYFGLNSFMSILPTQIDEGLEVNPEQMGDNLMTPEIETGTITLENNKQIVVDGTSNYFECVTDKKCLLEKAETCSLAKGIISESGLEMEHLIEGKDGDKCIYKGKVISSLGNIIPGGLEMRCVVLENVLSGLFLNPPIPFSSSTLNNDCVGTYIDFVKQQVELEKAKIPRD